MRVELTSDALADPAAVTAVLNLLSCFVDGRHDWAANDADVEALVNYLRVSAPAMSAVAVTLLGEKAITADGWTGTNTHVTTVTVTATTLEAAAHDLCQAALLVVENLHADRRFVESVAWIFGATRIVRAFEQGWLRPHHSGGGGDMPRVVAEARRHFRSTVRIVALADSDRHLPTDTADIETRLASAVEDGVTVHVLLLREAENYLPDKVLAQRRQCSHTLAAVRQLVPHQRGYYDMKKGFGPPDQSVKIPRHQQSLYESLPPQTRSDLRGGFGREILEQLHEHKGTLRPDDFAAIDPTVEQDLRILLSKIDRVI